MRCAHHARYKNQHNAVSTISLEALHQKLGSVSTVSEIHLIQEF